MKKYLSLAVRYVASVLLSPLLYILLKTNSEKLWVATVNGICINRTLGRLSLATEINKLVWKLEKSFLTEEGFVEDVSKLLVSKLNSDELRPFLQKEANGKNIDINIGECIGYSYGKRWHLKVHYMNIGNIHKLHAHKDVISIQIVAAGELDVQEYNIESVEADRLKVSLVRNGVAHYGDSINTTSLMNNIHGFKPRRDDTVRFQFYLRGNQPKKSVPQLNPKGGRLYVRILEEIGNGQFNAEILDDEK